METVVLILVFIFIGSIGVIVMRKVDVFLEETQNQPKQEDGCRNDCDNSKK